MPGQRDIDGGNWGRQRCSALCRSNKNYDLRADPEASYIYQAASEFAKRAEEYSGGTLTFTISGNGSLYGGDTAAGIKQLSAGSLDMVILATSVYASFNPGFNVLSVPYMFDDQAQLLNYLNSDTGKG